MERENKVFERELPKPDFLTEGWRNATSDERHFAIGLFASLRRADPNAFMGEGPATEETVTIDGNFDLLAVARLMLSGGAAK